MIAYHPTHFHIQELVDPSTWNLLGDKAWFLLDPRLLWTLDRLRERYDRAITINTWRWTTRSPLTMRGFRPAGATVGAEHSQHRYGRAADFDVEGMEAEDIRQDILSHQTDDIFKYIACLEVDISWVHMDVRNWDRAKNGILLVTPTT